MIKHINNLKSKIANVSQYFDIIPLLYNQGFKCVY